MQRFVAIRCTQLWRSPRVTRITPCFIFSIAAASIILKKLTEVGEKKVHPGSMWRYFRCASQIEEYEQLKDNWKQTSRIKAWHEFPFSCAFSCVAAMRNKYDSMRDVVKTCLLWLGVPQVLQRPSWLWETLKILRNWWLWDRLTYLFCTRFSETGVTTWVLVLRPG